MAAAWADASGASLVVRVRPAGNSSWGAPTVIPLAPGWSASGAVFPSLQQLVLRAAGPMHFLLVWRERNGSFQRIQAQRLSRSGAPVGSHTVLAGPDYVYLADVATNASGRAAVSYFTDASPTPFSVRVRDTESSSWRPAVTVTSVPVASIPGPWAFVSRVAVHSSGTVCAIGSASFTPSTVAVRSKCAPPAALGSAATQPVGTFTDTTTIGSLGPLVTMAATPEGFIVAGIAASTGTVPFPILAPVMPTVVRVRERPADSGAWVTAATLGQPGEVNVLPLALASAGGALVQFERLRGAVGSDRGSPGYGVDQRVAQQQGSGAWTPALTVSSLGISSSESIVPLLSAAALGPAGEVLVSAPVPQPAAPLWTTGFVRRSSWSGTWSSSTGMGVTTTSGLVIAASGRATALGVQFGTGDVIVVQSALPKPFVRQSARITAVPRVGVASVCGFAFTDAASITRQWRVNGVVRSTASKYTPTSADRGKTLVCRVTAANPTGTTVSASPGRTVA